MPEKNLLDTTYHYLIDASGECVTVTDATHPTIRAERPAHLQGPHILARSTRATVVARATGHGVFSRGGALALSTPNLPLIVR